MAEWGVAVNLRCNKSTAHDRNGAWSRENADVRKTDGRIISPIANFVARILMRDRF